MIRSDWSKEEEERKAFPLAIAKGKKERDRRGGSES